MVQDFGAHVQTLRVSLTAVARGSSPPGCRFHCVDAGTRHSHTHSRTPGPYGLSDAPQRHIAANQEWKGAFCGKLLAGGVISHIVPVCRGCQIGSSDPPSALHLCSTKRGVNHATLPAGASASLFDVSAWPQWRTCGCGSSYRELVGFGANCHYRGTLNELSIRIKGGMLLCMAGTGYRRLALGYHGRCAFDRHSGRRRDGGSKRVVTASIVRNT